MKEILIVDDDLFFVSLYKIKLAKEGYKIETASDGRVALDYVSKNRPGLMLIDLMIPIMDGFEVLKAMRDLHIASVKVIVVSTLSQAEDIERAKKLGAVEYLIKEDVSVSDVIDSVKKYLD